MPKLERTISGRYSFDEVLDYFHQNLLGGNISTSYEEGSQYYTGAVRCALRVYERYSIMGDGRLSLTLMLLENGGKIFMSAISAAGGRGVGKLVGWGEDRFLDDLRVLADQLETDEEVKS